jgi:hypothetical protein
MNLQRSAIIRTQVISDLFYQDLQVWLEGPDPAAIRSPAKKQEFALTKELSYSGR